MFSLDTFYQSKEWCGLMAAIKLSRLNDDGQLICEQCGKPIVRAYDCIGHHKVELTEDNVNDASVSLNPDNIALLHHRCHNIIHDRLGMSGSRKQVFLVYGSPLSGKSSYVDEVRQDGDLVIDMDSIWSCVSGCERYIKPPRLNAVVFGVRDYLLDSVKVRRGKWLSAYIIGGYPLISERERLCRELGAREIYIDSTREECLARCKDRPEAVREAYKGFIAKWWELYTPSIALKIDGLGNC